MTQIQKAVIGLTGLFVAGHGLAQEVEELEPMNVLARKFDSVAGENASSVGLVTGEELDRRQQYRLLDALDLIPGAQALSTAGLTGNTGAAIIRGFPSNYQQVVVDGVKVADATNGVGNFLANARLGGIGHLEVLRGPQSVLYGSGAGGGVLGYESQVGKGSPQTRLFGEGGSFGSYLTSVGSQGKEGNLAYGLEFGRQFTANDTFTNLPLHDFEQNYANLALEWQAREDLRFKFSYRGNDNLLKTTSISQWGTSNSEIQTETNLFALNGYFEVNPAWESRLTLGYYQENYRGDFDGSLFGVDYERFTLNWNHEIELGDQVTVITGVEGARSDYANTSGRGVSYSNYGAYANAYYRPVVGLQLEGGARWDEHDDFGGDAAWNVGAIYRFAQSGTRFHARMSEAYRNPTLLDSQQYLSAFSTQLANANLDSEKIEGFELGVSQEFGEHEVGITYFSQDLSDAIVTSFPVLGSTQRVNSPGVSKVSGLEISAEGSSLAGKLNYRLALTLQDREEVIDLPDAMVAFDLSYQANQWTLGGGVSFVDGAAYLAPGNPQTDSRTTTRLYGEYELNDSVSFHARVENLFDENYQLFPNTFGQGTQVEAPGRTFSVGATVRF
jgi:vitamin B12 transporter